MDLLAIGVFQFENLVRNRIPFLLLNQGVPLEGKFAAHLQQQMESQMKAVAPDEDFANHIPAEYPKHGAIIAVSHDPAKAKAGAELLFKRGYENVYYLNETYGA